MVLLLRSAEAHGKSGALLASNAHRESQHACGRHRAAPATPLACSAAGCRCHAASTASAAGPQGEGRARHGDRTQVSAAKQDPRRGRRARLAVRAHETRMRGTSCVAPASSAAQPSAPCSAAGGRAGLGLAAAPGRGRRQPQPQPRHDCARRAARRGRMPGLVVVEGGRVGGGGGPGWWWRGAGRRRAVVRLVEPLDRGPLRAHPAENPLGGERPPLAWPAAR
jgi:hypothetical protein